MMRHHLLLFTLCLLGCAAPGNGNTRGASSGLPRVDLTTRPWFPPVRAQQGFSCSQQTALYYLLTAEWNMKRGSDANLPQNRLSPYFAYTVLSGDRTGRSHVVDGWILSRDVGVPTVVDCPGFSRHLMHGYDRYHRAMGHRAAGWRVLPMSNASDIAAARDELAAGHLLACDFQIKGAALTKLPDGSYIVKHWGSTGPGHSMLYAGFDNNVSFDVNGDHRISTDIDINGDGRVTLADSERGAFLLVNPWGPRWGRNGRAWVLYREHAASRWPWARSVATVLAAPPYTPRLTLKFRITAPRRDNVELTMGVANSSRADAPSRTFHPLLFRREPASALGTDNVWEAFASLLRPGPHLSSGTLSQAGGGDLEMGIDLTPLGSGDRYFMEVNAFTGPFTGRISQASVLAYNANGRLVSETPLTREGRRWVGP